MSDEERKSVWLRFAVEVSHWAVEGDTTTYEEAAESACSYADEMLRQYERRFPKADAPSAGVYR